MLRRAAEKSDCEQQHAAILIDNNRVVAIGHNKSSITSSYLRRQWNLKSTHAEVAAIIKSNYDVSTTMIVVRMKRGRLMNSKPCLSCQAICRYFGVRKIVYSNEYGLFEVMKL